ncbi:hypothetical protein RZS08_05345, partial [Arthrospira platensis SPKY1]|nr:hypothetical protein [Arthrospira platensis SPKY1]
PQKGAFFTRGTSKDEYARYTEDAEAYRRNMDRLLLKWETAATLVPAPERLPSGESAVAGMIFFGTSDHAAREARDLLEAEGFPVEGLRILAFPFHREVGDFLDGHE